MNKNLKNKIEYTFSDIEEAVLKGKVDAGLIIHENRFTYQDKGLHKIIDLGEYWEKETQCDTFCGVRPSCIQCQPDW